MVYSLSRIPQGESPLVNAIGVLLNSPRLFFQVLQDIIDGKIELRYRVLDFDSLAQLDAEFKVPENNTLVMINGQGLARFKASTSTWVLASDDTTPIT